MIAESKLEYVETLRAAFAKHYYNRTDTWSNELSMRFFPYYVCGELKPMHDSRILVVVTDLTLIFFQSYAAML